MSSSSSNSSFHVAMFPWFAVGHITPFIHLANELAARGHRVSILLPKKARLQLQHLSRHPALIAFHDVDVPSLDGLPPGAETASDIHLSQSHLLAAAFDLTCPDVVEFLRSAASVQPVCVVFYDFAHWLPSIALMFRAKSVCYSVVSASSLAIALVPARVVPRDRALTEDDVSCPPPGYPSSTIVLLGPEARSLLFIAAPFGSAITFYDRATAAMRDADALCIRTCRELEGSLCDYMAAQYDKPVLLTGPILPDNATNTTPAALDPQWARWLDKFEPNSVVFCAFGSQYVLEKSQFQELLLAFELAGQPFLVALKPPVGCRTVEEAFPEGFEARVRGRGAVHGGWVQQPLILAHPAVGCFVNHCGFGSMWESLMSEAQIVLVPHLGDQILNTKLLAGELKVAVEVERDEYGRFSKEGLSRAIKTVMDRDSEVGVLVKKNHAKWRQELTKPGFMSGYVDEFVQDLQHLVNQNNKM